MPETLTKPNQLEVVFERQFQEPTQDLPSPFKFKPMRKVVEAGAGSCGAHPPWSPSKQEQEEQEPQEVEEEKERGKKKPTSPT